jgi:hypothetical protein
LYTPCILDCALRFSNKILYLLIKKKKNMTAIGRTHCRKPTSYATENTI